MALRSYKEECGRAATFTEEGGRPEAMNYFKTTHKAITQHVRVQKQQIRSSLEDI